MKTKFWRTDYRRQIGAAVAALVATGMFAWWDPDAIFPVYMVMFLFLFGCFYVAAVKQAGQMYLADKFDESPERKGDR